MTEIEYGGETFTRAELEHVKDREDSLGQIARTLLSKADESDGIDCE
jgi:hypothetical protein